MGTRMIPDVDIAIEYLSRALDLAPSGHSYQQEGLLLLSMALSIRARSPDRMEDFGTTIEHISRSLALTSEGHPQLTSQHQLLARICVHQYHLTKNAKYLQDSLNSFRQACQSQSGSPGQKFRGALSWAKDASIHGELNCLEAYQTTIDLLPQFIWLGATSDQRYKDLDDAKNLAIEAATAAIRFSNYVLAMEWLKHARCVVCNQSLMLRSPLDKLHSIHPTLANRLQEVTDQLNVASSESAVLRQVSGSSSSLTPEQASQQHRRLAKDYNDLLLKIRKLQGFEDFLQPMKANHFMNAARNGPIVVVICVADSCNALIILPGQDNVNHIPLPAFTEKKAQDARSEIQISLRRKGLRERGVKVRREDGHEPKVGNVIAALWKDIVKPILDYLGYIDNVSAGTLPHITWCPTGSVSFLPLHAAGDYDQPQSRIFDYAISSYTPTLTALLSSSPSLLSPNSRLLAICQEHTPGRSPLPGTAKEIKLVKAHAQNLVNCTWLTNDQATTTAVLDAMEQHDWVHLACDAHQNVKDAPKSGFYLHDGTLDLASINRRSFKNKGLAFLSACQTATGDDNLPDEAVHLASGMLMAGYPSVIATMWSVSDEDAPFVADEVYGRLMKEGKVGNGEAGQALHNAVRELRQKVGEKEFERWVPYIHVGS